MDFYYFPSSPNCRSVMMAAKAVGVELNKKLLNTFAGDHLKPEFLRINPQHTVPTIVDHDLVLSESRAILIYLAEMYGRDDSLYPRIPKEKALVNQRLYFDISTLNQSFMEYYAPQFNSKPADPVAFQKVESAFALLDTFLIGQEYVAGDHLTVADIAILASVSTFEVMEFDIGKYKNVSKWYANAQKVTPGWDENLDGLNKMKEIVAPLIKVNG